MYNFSLKKFIIFFKIIIINILLILYLSELTLTLFFKPKTNLYLDLGYQRYIKAKELGIDFDRRSFYQAFYEEKQKEPLLSPKYRFSKTHYGSGIYGEKNPIRNFINKKMTNQDLIPFRGPINKKTLSCNEEGTRRIINNDKYGFKNSNSIYDKEINIILVGDSFAQGVCQDTDNDIAGFLRNKYNFNTANYGVGGTGPLTSLATIKEYGSYFKPTYVVYFYFEGNDMQDLSDEKKTFLIKYLSNFKQNLYIKNDEVKLFFNEYETAAYKIFEERYKTNVNKFQNDVIEEIKKSEKRKKVEIIKDFFELQKIKKFFLSKSFYDQNNNKIDEELFVDILKEMNNEINQWNGNFIFVYLPSWNRFHQKYSFVNFLHRNKIENIVKSLNINYIDMINEFQKTPDPINFYPFGLRGHFTSKGYSLVADSVFEKINSLN